MSRKIKRSKPKWVKVSFNIYIDSNKNEVYFCDPNIIPMYIDDKSLCQKDIEKLKNKNIKLNQIIDIFNEK